MISVGNFLQILSSHYSQRGLCGPWKKFVFSFKFSFFVTSGEFDLAARYVLLLLQNCFLLFPPESRFRVFSIPRISRSTWLLLLMGILQFRSSLSLSISINMRALKHGNAFSHFCL